MGNLSIRYCDKLAWLSCLFLLLSARPWAEEVRLCGVEWPPFTRTSPEAPGLLGKGLSVEILQQAFARMGKPLKIENLPWVRCLASVQEGHHAGILDNASSDALINGRHPTAIYPLAIYARRGPFLPKKSKNQGLIRWRDLNKQKVGLVRGYDYTPKISKFHDWQADYADSDEMLIRKLLAGRVDYAVLDLFSADLFAEQQQAKLFRYAPILDVTWLYLCFGKQHKNLLQQYESALESMVMDGSLDKLYRKYFDLDYAQFLRQYASSALMQP